MINFKKIVAILVIISFISMLQFASADPPLPTPVGRVVWVKGTLAAIMANNEKRILQKMSVIYLHDTLTTDSASRAQIAFTDGTLMSFYPSSKVSVDQYSLTKKKAPRGQSIGKSVMSLIEGGFRTITGLIANQNPVDYKVNTPVATIGVRGTDYVVRIQNNRLYIGYYAGEPCITGKDPKGSQLCLSQSAPFASVAAAGLAPVLITQMPDALSEKLNIVPAQISPFGTQSKTQGKTSSGGPITSFCITN